MKICYICAAFVLLSTTTAEAVEKRCGWFVNPTPANAWLLDRHGEWTIGVQGGYQADGDWPAFTDKQWVETNGHYGHGCACLDVESDQASKKILRILKSQPKSLSDCRNDNALPKVE
jgi:hypothetical protein